MEKKKKENQRVALTRRLLKESLLQLLNEKNIGKITTTELCELAEINRSTFYSHYETPLDVFNEIGSDLIEGLDQIWEREKSRRNWTQEKRIELFSTYFQENAHILKPLFRNGGTEMLFSNLLFQSTHVQSIYQESFANVTDENERKLIFAYITGGSCYLIRQCILEDIPKTPKEIGELIYMMGFSNWWK